VLSVALTAGAQQAAAESNIRLAAETPVIAMAEWEVQQTGAAEQTGARILIAAGADELTRAPAKAARYESQAFKFNHGEIRILNFHKASGGVLHQITTETQLYVVKGSATVGVAGQIVQIRSGDVVNLPSGVLRSIANAVEDTTLILHTVRSSQPGAKAALVRASDTPASPLTAGPKVGVDNVKVSVQRYSFDGNSIRVARLVGPGKTGIVTPPVDALIYLLSGRMEITIGDEVKVVKAGDAVCEAAGLATHWDVLEESSFVATNGAKAAP
jgi:quercetin dioxygenase-like cupin family protein